MAVSQHCLPSPWDVGALSILEPRDSSLLFLFGKVKFYIISQVNYRFGLIDILLTPQMR